jgi:hypothetical protein
MPSLSRKVSRSSVRVGSARLALVAWKFTDVVSSVSILERNWIAYLFDGCWFAYVLCWWCHDCLVTYNLKGEASYKMNRVCELITGRSWMSARVMREVIATAARLDIMVLNMKKKCSGRNLRTVLALITPVLFGFGPCGPIAGTSLTGEVKSDVIADFRFVDDVESCALEVNGDDPHSVNINCWTVGKQLFVGCSDCEGKTWSSLVAEDSMARVKIGETLYPVKVSRMSDPGAIDRIWRYRWEKYKEGELEAVPDGFWIYHLGSKPPARG